MIDLNFNFASTSDLSDSYDNVSDYIIDEIKNSDEYKELDLTTRKGQNEAQRLLEEDGDFWLATIDGLNE